MSPLPPFPASAVPADAEAAGGGQRHDRDDDGHIASDASDARRQTDRRVTTPCLHFPPWFQCTGFVSMHLPLLDSFTYGFWIASIPSIVLSVRCILAVVSYPNKYAGTAGGASRREVRVPQFAARTLEAAAACPFFLGEGGSTALLGLSGMRSGCDGSWTGGPSRPWLPRLPTLWRRESLLVCPERRSGW
jgi:hypothetical protein